MPRGCATGQATRTAAGGSPPRRPACARGLTRAAEDPHLAAWRQAFSAFGAKPSKFPSSAEALGARVPKGQPLPRLNRLVDRGVTCRRWNWRQGARTQLTEDTRSAFFVLDRLAPMPINQLDAAAAELADGLRALCPDAAVSVLKLTADQTEAA